MIISGWRYYNHAAIPTNAPHEMPNLEPVNNGMIWKMEKASFIGKMDNGLGLWI